MSSIKTIDIAAEAKPTHIKKVPNITGDAFVGKDVLELISVSMYVEPLTLYREYIQNATDSIDQAVSDKTLGSIGEGEVVITISQSDRSIKITDNGTGIPTEKFAEVMLAFGASEKRGTNARGFRGIGRFSGLGYCQKMVFRSKAKGETTVSEAEWDGRMLKRLLADNSERLSISDLVRRVASFFQYEDREVDSHFFEIEMSSVIRMGNDILLNEDAAKRYVSQVCPVPYSDDFPYKEKLENILCDYEVSPGYNIIVKDDYSDSALIHRPYRERFSISESESDAITGVEVFELEGVHGGTSAVGWLFQHEYKGLMPSLGNIRGIRVRVGNTQIGDETLMGCVFPEPRFNSWSMGEIHIVEKGISPNGRRDNFDNNIHWLEIQNQFSQQAKSIARICRKNSAERNTVKQFHSEINKIDQFQGMLDSGVLSKAKSKEVRERIAGCLVKAEKLSSGTSIRQPVKNEVLSILDSYKRKYLTGGTEVQKVNDIFEVIPKSKAGAIKEVFDFIFEYSPNKVLAQSMIDKIVAQYRIRYER